MKKFLKTFSILLFVLIFAATAFAGAKTKSKTKSKTESKGSYVCSSNYYNCKDFGTHNEAQKAYEYCLGQGSGDVHDLDRDNDGVACEDLK